ncbi:MAG: hypothetical protein U0Q15_01705 [Kineosporiaceae bacterium]
MTSLHTPDAPTEFPREPLPPLRHEQVKQFLLRETATPPRRRCAVRVAVPALAATLTAAAVVTAVTVLPHREPRAAVPGATTQEPFVDDGRCGASQFAPLDQAPDGVVRLGELQDGWTARATRRLVRFCTDPTEPLGAWRRASNGEVTAALTLAARVAPRAGILLADDETPLNAGAKVQVRGREGRFVADVSGAATGPSLLRWEEGGRSWELRGSGLTRAQVLAAATDLRLSGGAASWPDAGAQGWTATPLKAATPTGRDEWTDDVTVDVGPPPANPGASEVTVMANRRPGRTGVDLAVRGLPARIVTVGGHEAALLDDSLLTWDASDGVLVSATAVGDLTGDALVTWARTVVPVPATDPRLIDQTR